MAKEAQTFPNRPCRTCMSDSRFEDSFRINSERAVTKRETTDTDSAELEPIKDMDISSTRTFKIRKSNGAEGDRFKIEGPSNSRLQLSVG